MSLAKVTMLGYQEYLRENHNCDLFDNLTFPEGVDKELVSNEIILQGSEFECVDSDPFFMRNHIGQWSSKWSRTFQKWVDLLAIAYNPLENYDRQENWNDTRTDDLTDTNYGKDTSTNSGVDTTSNSGVDTTSNSGTDKEKHTGTDVSQDSGNDVSANTGNDVNTTRVSAFNSTGFQDKEEVTTANGLTVTNTHGLRNELTHGETVENEHGLTTELTHGLTTELTHGLKNEYVHGHTIQHTGTQGNVHGGRVHGNVGVTTSQQMWLAEQSLDYWNLVQHIVDLFLQEFCIMVYD